MAQLPFFESPIEGDGLDVVLQRHFFDVATADHYTTRLMTEIPWGQEEIILFGKRQPIPRHTAWFGDAGMTYTYSGIRMDPHAWDESPVVLEIKSAVEKYSEVTFNSLLLNLYRNGTDGVAWHSDDEQELGHNPTIGSVSFGSTRKFQFKSRDNPSDKREILLESGDVLIMKGTTQEQWLHQIPKTSKPVGPRINLTFRQIKFGVTPESVRVG